MHLEGKILSCRIYVLWTCRKNVKPLRHWSNNCNRSGQGIWIEFWPYSSQKLTIAANLLFSTIIEVGIEIEIGEDACVFGALEALIENVMSQGDPVWAISSATVTGILDLSLNFFYVLPLANMGELHDIFGLPLAFRYYPCCFSWWILGCCPRRTTSNDLITMSFRDLIPLIFLISVVETVHQNMSFRETLRMTIVFYEVCMLSCFWPTKVCLIWVGQSSRISSSGGCSCPSSKLLTLWLELRVCWTWKLKRERGWRKIR